jgi:hypothetical protein
MAYSPIQSKAYTNSTTIDNFTITPDSTITAGNAVILTVDRYSGARTVTSVKDQTGTSLTFTDTTSGGLQDTGNGVGSHILVLLNMPSGVTSLKVTFSSAVDSVDMCLHEFSGIATSGAIDSACSIGQAEVQFAPTTADGLTSGSATNTMQPALVFGHARNNSAAALPAVGTGFTGLTTTGLTRVTNEHKRVTSLASQAATFTISVGANVHNVAMVVLAETAGTPAATLSSPTPSGTIGTATTATLGATTNQGTAGSNNIYGVWSASNGFSGVTATQVKAGQNAAGSTSGVSNSGAVAVTTTSPTISVSSLSASTTYYYALVQNNANGDSNVVTGSFTTSAVTTSTSLGMRDNSNAAVASTSINWYLTSTWGGSVLASGTTSTDGAGALTLTGLSLAAGTYMLFYKLASDQTSNGMHTVVLV